MIYNFETEGVFISQLNGNEKNPSEQPVRIKWRLPRPAEKYKIIKSYPAFDDNNKPIIGEDGKQCVKVEYNIDELLRVCAVEIENVSINDKKIITGLDLSQVPLYELADEFGVFMLDKIQGAFNPKN